MIEWIKLLSTQSNEVCESSAKKTISPEHVTEALKVSSPFQDHMQDYESNGEGELTISN